MPHGAPRPVGRRAFLGSAAAATILGGCGGGDSGPARPTGSSPPTSAPGRRLASDPFRLGVASGDPLADRVVLWTRLAPLPLAGGLAGMPDEAVDVRWEVATDPSFAPARVVASGTTVAEPGAAHSVHADAAGLDPATDYLYRFSAGGWTSPVGRTRTAPEPGTAPKRLGLAVVACQDFGSGYYAAYRHLLAEPVDAVVHLGDYIYEWPFAVPDRPVLPAGVPASLEDYRLRHATYRSDPDLQAAHARFPFVCMWDDHDVFNNYAGDTLPDVTATADDVRARRAAAYRAYWEHLPLRMPAPTTSEVTLYRELRFGDLARICLLDLRQYAAEPPCRDGSGEDFGDCPARGQERSNLGGAQEAWLDGALTDDAPVGWNLVASSTLLAGLDVGRPGDPQFYLESWDGYPTQRRRLLDRLAGTDVTNPVVLSSDWHIGLVNDVRPDPDDPAGPVVCTELMAPPISSPLYDVAQGQNPHIRHAARGHGYLVLGLDPDQLTATFRLLDDVGRANAEITTDSTWLLRTGDPTARRRE